MSEAGKRFEEVLEDDARLEAVAKGLHMAMRNLLAEINAKPVEKRTDAESSFVKGFVSITILGIISNPIGGKP